MKLETCIRFDREYNTPHDYKTYLHVGLFNNMIISLLTWF